MNSQKAFNSIKRIGTTKNTIELQVPFVHRYQHNRKQSYYILIMN